MKRLFAGLALTGIALLCAGGVQAAPINFEYGVTVQVPGDAPPVVGFPTFLGPNVFFDETNGSGTSELRLRPESDLSGTLDASGPGTDITTFFPAFRSDNSDTSNPNVFNVPVTINLTIIDVASMAQNTFVITGDLKATVSIGQTNFQSFTITSGLPAGPTLIGGTYYYFVTEPPSGLYSGAGGAGAAPLFGNEGKQILHVQATAVPEPGTVTLLSCMAVDGLLSSGL